MFKSDFVFLLYKGDLSLLKADVYEIFFNKGLSVFHLHGKMYSVKKTKQKEVDEMRVAEHLTERVFKVNSKLVAETVMVKDLTDGDYYIMIEVFNEGDYRKREITYLADNIDVAEDVYEGTIKMLEEELGFIQVSGKLGGIHYEG